jgi:hypothetical protein
MFGKSTNQQKFKSLKTEEQIQLTECLLLFSIEYFVFLFAIPKYKD